MKRYMIERDISGIGDFSTTELCGAARASNQALATIGSAIQWQHSYVAGDKTFCVYLAESEDDIQKLYEALPCPSSSAKGPKAQTGLCAAPSADKALKKAQALLAKSPQKASALKGKTIS